MPKNLATVQVVTEEERNTGTEFPFVVIGLFTTRKKARAAVAKRRRERRRLGLSNRETQITWNIERSAVQ